MIRFELPSLGADMDEGTLLEWKVKPGDAVARGQVIAVVDTSKAAVEVEIWQAGTVSELLVQPGEKIPVGTVMATLEEAGEAAAAGAAPAAAVGPAPLAAPEAAAASAAVSAPAAIAASAPAAASPVAAAAQAAVPSLAAPAPGPVAGAAPPRPAIAPAVPPPLAAARRPISPAARRRARELDLDPDRLAGTGPGGAVTIADVEQAAAGGAQASVAPAAADTSRADRQKAMRAAIAAAMSRSKREIPHYYLSETIPMAHALGWLAQRNADLPITGRILPAVLQLKAVAVALRRTPELNGFHRDGGFQPSAAVHAGVAISLRAGAGLVAPALHDVGTRSLEDLMRGLADLVKRARAGSLRSSEMSDPTITVTNLGDQGVDSVFGVIYPPQVAIVGFGRIVERAWAQDGWIRPMPVTVASLAADHRVSDGHRGAVFLAELRDWLQHPQELADEK